MIEGIHFLNKQLLWPVVLIGFLLLIVFIWKEWSTKRKNSFYINVLIALISLVALLMLVLKPATSTTAQTKIGALLTDGYSERRLDSLMQVFRNISVNGYQKNRPMQATLDSITSLYILGKGIAPTDFWQLENHKADYLGKPKLQGVIELNYSRELQVGDEFEILGKYNGPKKGNRLLVSDSSGRGIDSVIFKNEEELDFRLSVNTKVQGRFIFELLEKDSLGSVISKEPLPVNILPKQTLKLLVINSFPTFESKYLKNYLAEMGHEVTVRNQLTRGKYKFEYFNTDRSPIYSFSTDRLKPYDLLIIDATTYFNFSKSTIELLQDAIKKEGLGIFLLPDNNFFRLHSKISGFDFVRDNNVKTNIDSWLKTGWEKFPYSFKSDFGVEKIHYSKGKNLTAYRRLRQGRIGTTVLKNTYQFVLDGKTESYRRFWSDIVSTLSKRKNAISEINAASQFCFQNEPYSFEVRTSIENPEIEDSNGQIPLLQAIDISDVWRGRIYPKKKGWEQLSVKGDSTTTFEFFVMDTLNWNSLTDHQISATNRREFNSTSKKMESKKVTIPINQIWFLLIFLLGMVYLWLIPKVTNSD